jgi:hypothetical protein
VPPRNRPLKSAWILGTFGASWLMRHSIAEVAVVEVELAAFGEGFGDDLKEGEVRCPRGRRFGDFMLASRRALSLGSAGDRPETQGPAG